MIYLPTLELQTTYFLYSIVLGLVIGLVYDFMRIIREIIYLHKKPKFYISDILIFVFSAYLITFYTVAMGFGQLRLLAILGAVLGFIIYINTMGLFSMFLLKKVLKIN